jgi:hypothetical protein
MTEYVREVNESDFDRIVLQSKLPVLVDLGEMVRAMPRACANS